MKITQDTRSRTGLRFVAGAIRSLTLVAAGSVVVAGCHITSTAGLSAPGNSPPATSTGHASADPQPRGEAACYLLSRQQVQSALGFSVKSAVHSPGDCIYDFLNRAGEINFGLDVSSRDRARTDFNADESTDEVGDDSTLRRLTGIGQDAFLFVANGQGTAVEVLSGDTIFSLQVYWTEAPHKPDIAIGLARDAIARLHPAS